MAHDLAVAIVPYQPALTAALNAATELPLVGKQLNRLPEFATALSSAEESIARQVDGAAADGHHQVVVSLPALSKTFSFDLGLDAFLKATAVGNVSATIQPTLTLAYDVSAGSATFDIDQSRFDIGFGLSLPGFQGTFSLNGLLFTKAVDAGTSFNGDLGFQFEGGAGLTPQFSGTANVLMGLSMSFVDPALNPSFNPTFRATLDLDWGFGAGNQLAAPSAALKDMGLEADGFLRGFLGDVVTTVQKFTKPIQPFIDVFQTPVPILSAFDSGETVGALMLKGAGMSSEQQAGFKMMVQVINAVNSIDLSGGSGGAIIPFGSVAVTGDPRSPGGFGFDTGKLTNAIDAVFHIPALDDVEGALKQLANYSGETAAAGLRFPLLEDPDAVIGGILSGRADATLFSFTTGRRHFELAPSIGVGIPGILGIFLDAGITFDANLSMGYDVAGLLAFAQNPGDAGQLLRGFYFDNGVDDSIPTTPGDPVIRKTGLYLKGFAELKADAVLAHVSGGLYANIAVELANADPSNRVRLDTMIHSLGARGKVFNLSGKLYASADLSLGLELPIGPDITLFRYNLGHEELVNFDPAPPPSGVSVTVIDVVDQHALTLDAGKMGAGSVVTVQPFYDATVSAGGDTFEASGIRVDYPGEIYLYVERKRNATTNYYNLITLSGPAPDGSAVVVNDPFRVFADEGVSNPAPAGAKPAVLLVGGKNVNYAYNEGTDGSGARALLVGGYGSSTLSGGTMMFGNFIPADRVAAAKAHLEDGSGFDGGELGLINARGDGVVAPADPAGVIGSTMTGGRGGLMLGGPGTNSFIAVGAGAYEMIGGPWINAFNISPSFGGVPATYRIDGGPFGQSALIVRAPADEDVLFENAAEPDKYNPQYKALAVGGKHGPSAVAHGIQTVKIFAAPGSTVEFGDTSELNVQFSIVGGARLKFSGTAAPDVFDVIASGPFFAGRDHFTVGQNYAVVSMNGNGVGMVPGDNVPIVPPGVQYETYPLPPTKGLSPLYFNPPLQRWPDPVYAVKRTFGTNGRTQTIAFAVSDPDTSSITLDGKGADDAYHVALGVGGFLDVGVDDSDAATRNQLALDVLDWDLAYHRATLTDNAIALEYYTAGNYLGWRQGVTDEGKWADVVLYFADSVYYHPTASFGDNVDVAFTSKVQFEHFTVDRPKAAQDIALNFGGYSAPPSGAPRGFGYPDRLLEQYGAFVHAPDSPLRGIHRFMEPGVKILDATIDVMANAGKLSILAPAFYGRSAVWYLRGGLWGEANLILNVSSNSGALSFKDETGRYLGTGDVINIRGNSGAISLAAKAQLGNPINGVYAKTPQSVYNVSSNTGTINIAGQIAAPILNIGGDAGAAGVQGVINLALRNNDGLRVIIDDRNNPAAGREWNLEADRVQVDGLVINTDARAGSARHELWINANPGSAARVNGEPPFFRVNLIGTGAGNTLIGPARTETTRWHIEGPDRGWMPLGTNFTWHSWDDRLNEIRWTGFQNLVGGARDDSFRFLGASLADIGGSVSGSIDGGGGLNTLVYHRPPAPFRVDLEKGIAPLVGGTVASVQSVVTQNPADYAPPAVALSIKNSNILTSIYWDLPYSGSYSATGDGPWTATVDHGDGTGPQNLLLTPAKTFQFNHLYAAPGLYTVTVLVDDYRGNVGRRTFIAAIRGNPSGTGTPIVDLGSNVDDLKGGVFSRSGSFTASSDGPWTAIVDYGDAAGVAPLPLNPDGTFALNHAYGAPGSFWVTVALDNGRGAVGWGRLYVKVTDVPDKPIEIDPPLGDRRGGEGDSVNLPVSATSPFGLPLSFDIRGLPPGLAWDPASRAIAGVIAPGAAGASPYRVVVVATDGTRSARAEFDWSIIALNALEVTPAGASLAPGTTMQFRVTGVYADDSTADLTGRVLWSSSSSAVATISASGLATALTPGSTTITATFGAIRGSTAMAVEAPRNPAVVASASAGWGTKGEAALETASDGLRLLSAGRSKTIGWLGVNRIGVTLDRAATLTAADVMVSGLVGGDYGGVTLTGSAATWVITLNRPIAAADRVTITIGNADVATFIRRLDVLPGDVNDDGVVTMQDAIFIRNGIMGFKPQPFPVNFLDILGEGVATLAGYNAVRRLIGSRLPS